MFNDRYGSERVYFSGVGEDTYFASEAKALLCVVPGTRQFDEQGVQEWLAYGSISDWRTLFRGIEVLPGASLWRLGGHGSQVRRIYFDPAEWESQTVLAPAEFEAQYVETFRAILPAYFQADSGVGISITGGLDTRMIMAGYPENGSEASRLYIRWR